MNPLLYNASSLRRLLIINSMGEAENEYTVTGNPVSFKTNIAKPLNQMLIPFSPVQSGTGDPSPENIRPITGWTGVNVTRAGANLLENTATSSTVNGTTFTVNADKTVTVSDTPTANAGKVIHSGLFWDGNLADSYTHFDTLPTGIRVFCRRVTNDGTTSYPTLSNGSLLSSGYKFYDLTLQAQTTFGGSPVTVGFQLSLDSSASAYEPYSGTTIPVVFPAMGKNLLNPVLYTGGTYNPTAGDTWTLTKSAKQLETSDNKTFTITTERAWEGYTLIVPVEQAKYRMSGTIASTSLAVSRCYLGENFNVLYKTNNADASQSIESTWNADTALSGQARYIAIVFSNGSTASETITITNPMVETGTTTTAYEPYTTTAYGGSLDATTGTLTVDHVCYSPLSSYTPSSVTSVGTYTRCAYSASANKPTYSAKGDVSLQKYSHGLATNIWAGDYSHGYVTGNQIGYFWFPCEATAEAIQAYLLSQEQAGTPVTVCYPIPDEDVMVFHLDPITIQTLIGDNVIFSDTNGENTIKYLKKG